MFSSDYSNQNAERTGYKTDAEIKYLNACFFLSRKESFSQQCSFCRYEDLVKTHPEFDLSRVKSKSMSIKTLVCSSD